MKPIDSNVLHCTHGLHWTIWPSGPVNTADPLDRDRDAEDQLSSGMLLALLAVLLYQKPLSCAETHAACSYECLPAYKYNDGHIISVHNCVYMYVCECTVCACLNSEQQLVPCDET